MRGDSRVETSSRRTTSWPLDPDQWAFLGPVGDIDTSASLFHSPHEGQRPSHLGVSLPQASQTKTVLALVDLGIRCRPVLTINRGLGTQTSPDLILGASV